MSAESLPSPLERGSLTALRGSSYRVSDPGCDPTGGAILQFLHRALQFLVDDVRIDHRRRGVGVTEGLLHHPDVPVSR